MPEARPIAEFFSRPRTSEHAVLLGKGPSLDKYRAAKPGTYVMGVNEVPLAHRCDGVAFLDDPSSRANYSESLDIFRRVAHESAHGGRGWAFDGTYGPLDESNPHSLQVIGPSSPCVALAIFARWGIRRVDLWGFDTMWQLLGAPEDRYANCVRPHLIQDGRQLNDMERGTKGILWALKRWGFDWESHGWDHG